MDALQVVLFLALPALLMRVLGDRHPWLSPVMLAYALGALLGNLVGLRREVTEGVVTASVLLGIPLLLFPADFLGWLRLARKTALGCALFFGSVIAVALLSAPLFARRVDEGWIVAGMLVATYTGSTPNMAAVARGLGAKPETLALVTTTDFVVAGSFAFYLLSPFVRWIGRLLPPFEPADEPAKVGPTAPHPTRRAMLVPLGLALPIAAVSGAVGLAAGEAGQLVGILVVTALGVLASLSPWVRRLPWSHALGEWFILVFCFAFGTMIELGKLLESTSSLPALAWTAVVLLGATALHLVLCRLARIDRDTAVVTAAAGIYGPPFIGPIAANLKNRELVLSGITAALAGLATGTYLGVLVSWAVRALLG